MVENAAIALLLDSGFLPFQQKLKKHFFRFLVKLKVVLMVFVAVCHTFDNDHVKGNLHLTTHLTIIM